ncbi:MAG: hypothetical protein LQ342_007734 [Letrouitia transgressa]|nr:MAG: hypothetical protein LQ342_007734 [Letrouitia transgressa]
MASHEQPYDPYIPSGRAGTPGANGQHYEGSDRTAALQAQIDDTVNVMRQNIQRTEQRGENIDTLDHKTQGLSTSAENFKRGANRVRKQQVWKNIKWWIIIISVVVILIIVIALAVHFGKK